MPRRQIEFTKGSYYHLTNRTPSGITLFRKLKDYLRFMDRLEYYAKESDIKIIAYSLMPTHYHILIKQENKTTATKFINRLSISYSKSFCNYYNHHGSVFGHRFSATIITDLYQMLNTCCYIHANSYKARLVENPIDWPYGNLSLFLYPDFWNNETDTAILESFGSLTSFKKTFDNYITTIR